MRLCHDDCSGFCKKLDAFGSAAACPGDLLAQPEEPGGRPFFWIGDEITGRGSSLSVSNSMAAFMGRACEIEA